METAKKTSDILKDRKRNTWYISDKIAITYMHIGKYEVAVKLLQNARAGYVVNTYAVAMLLSEAENLENVKEKLKKAAFDKHNLAKGLSQVLFAYVLKQDLKAKDLSDKNKKLADILGLSIIE